MNNDRTAPLRTRFAPSPTGYLHMGHAYSAEQAFGLARDREGICFLRIEDIDIGRCRSEFEQAIYEDLAWLGHSWLTPVIRQSDHFARYREAIAKLTQRDLTYPCFCTRKEIAQEIERSPSAPHGPEGPLYPGTCKRLTPHEREQRAKEGVPFAIRLDLENALDALHADGQTDLSFNEEGQGPEGETGTIPAAPEDLGDIVLARKDIPTSYHVSVVLDDASQNISHIVRGQDLFHATHIHRVLQALWDLPTPVYLHHPLLRDDTGNRLAKRNKAQTIRALRQSGTTPVEVRERLQSHPK